ncbi:MAG: DUF3365 domain-containing protein [Myxococcota bacterium]
MSRAFRRGLEVGVGLAVATAAVVWLSGGLGERVAPSEAQASEGVREAAAAIGRLRAELGEALAGALQQGPEAAIDVCRLEAPRIAGRVAPAGISVGRTSHRLRNPENAPQAWMVPLLEEFARSEPTPGASRTVDLGARGTGYVEPIYVQPLCTTCHGEQVAPALLERIREHYPDDRAVGFREGEFRGLFWAVVELEPPP